MNAKFLNETDVRKIVVQNVLRSVRKCVGSFWKTFAAEITSGSHLFTLCGAIFPSVMSFFDSLSGIPNLILRIIANDLSSHTTHSYVASTGIEYSISHAAKNRVARTQGTFFDVKQLISRSAFFTAFATFVVALLHQSASPASFMPFGR